jgi:hypothetical protein
MVSYLKQGKQFSNFWERVILCRISLSYVNYGEEEMSYDLFERRQAERRYALKFLDYEILSASGEVTGRGLARTLNVSETGLRLETSQFFEPEQQLRITLGLNNDLVQINGRVINSQPETDDLCTSGIMFLEFDETVRHTYQKHFDALKSALEE